MSKYRKSRCLLLALSQVAVLFLLLNGAPPAGANAAAPLGAPLLFFDSAEHGLNGWRATGLWHQQPNPEQVQVLSPQINPELVTLPQDSALPPAYSGTTVWWYGDETTGTYCSKEFLTLSQSSKNGCQSAKPTSGTLQSPLIDLRTQTSVTLSFQTWWEIEGANPTAFDLMQVLVIPDGEQPQLIGQLNPATAPADSPDMPYSNSGPDAEPHYQQIRFDLSAFSGKRIQIAFRFDSVDGSGNGFRGWILDDIAIWGGKNSPVTPSLAGVTPNSLPAAQLNRSVVTITGNGFTNGATVFIGKKSVSELVVQSESTLVCLLPVQLAPGVYPLTISIPGKENLTQAGAITITGPFPGGKGNAGHDEQSGVPTKPTPESVALLLAFLAWISGMWAYLRRHWRLTARVSPLRQEALRNPSQAAVTQAASGAPPG